MKAPITAATETINNNASVHLCVINKSSTKLTSKLRKEFELLERKNKYERGEELTRRWA